MCGQLRRIGRHPRLACGRARHGALVDDAGHAAYHRPHFGEYAARGPAWTVPSTESRIAPTEPTDPRGRSAAHGLRDHRSRSGRAAARHSEIVEVVPEIPPPPRSRAAVRTAGTGAFSRGRRRGSRTAAAARRGPVGPDHRRLCDPRSRRTARRKMGAVVRVAPGLHGADGGAQPPLPVSHRHRGDGAQHAHGNRVAADDRERVQPDRDVDQPGVRNLAVHSIDRQALWTDAGLLGRFAPRRARRDRQGARLPDQASRRFRRLAIGARRLQLGRRQRGEGAGPEQGEGPTPRTTRASPCPPKRATICRNCRP